MFRRTRFLWLGLAVAVLAITQAVVRAQNEQQDDETAGSLKAHVERLSAEVQADDQPNSALKPSEYWIGVMFTPITEFPLAQAQLGLEQGMVVVEVIDDAPASRAGLRQHDIVRQFSGHEVAGREDLIQRIAERKDQPIDVVLLRGGKEMSLTITPEKRPDLAAHQGAATALAEARRRADELTQNEDLCLTLPEVIDHDGWQTLRMLQLRPGFLIEEPPNATGVFPPDLSLTIQKQGEQPTQIRVEKGDQRWQVTEDRIPELPEDIRPFVEQYLNRRVLNGVTILQAPAPLTGTPTDGQPGAAPELRVWQAERAPSLNLVEERLQQVLVELAELRRQVAAMQGTAEPSK